jgi:hypothetical protein
MTTATTTTAIARTIATIQAKLADEFDRWLHARGIALEGDKIRALWTAKPAAV